MMFRTPAAVQALLKKRRLDKLKSEALLRDFPAQDLDDSVLHESSILYEDQTLCEHLDNGPKIPLFERRLVLTYDGFEVITPDGDRKAVPINRVVAAQAEDARKGTLALRNGIYSWQTAGTWDDSWGSTAMLSSVPTLQRPSLGECGDLEEVTCKYNPHASIFTVRTLALNPDPEHGDYKLYTFVCSTLDARNQWLDAFELAVAHFKAQPLPTALQKAHATVAALYQSETFQITMAGLILANFTIMTFEAQLLPDEGSDAAAAFASLETVFTVIFSVELAVNFIANFFWEFVSSGWNWFDVLIVSTAVISQTGLVDTGGLVHLRLLKAFRVMRFFNRIPSLQKIIVALYASIPAMANAMALTLMVLAMYSVMAVTFYHESAEEYFGTFGKALFTLFQFSTGDGWTDVVRAIPFSSEIDSLLLSVFFVSFMIIVSIVLMQVVIAVLLEEFSKIGSEEAGPIGSNTDFDFSPNPFGVYMSQFSMAQDEEDLKTMIKMLFKAVVVSAGLVQQQPRTHGPQDEIADGLHVDKIRLDYDALHRGVLALQVKPPCVFTKHHWHSLAVKRGFVDEDGLIGLHEFSGIVRACLYKYHIHQLNFTISDKNSSRELVSVARALKFLLIRHGPLRAQQLDGKGQAGLDFSSPLNSPLSPDGKGLWGAAGVGVVGETAGQMCSMQESIERLCSKVDGLQQEVQQVRQGLESLNHNHHQHQDVATAFRHDKALSIRTLNGRTSKSREGVTEQMALGRAPDTPRDQVQTPREEGQLEMPDGWKHYWSRSRQRYYYRNKRTGQSSWIRPSADESQDNVGLPAGEVSSADIASKQKVLQGSGLRTRSPVRDGVGGGAGTSYSQRRSASREGVTGSVGAVASSMPQAQIAKIDMRGLPLGKAPRLKLSPRGRRPDQDHDSQAQTMDDGFMQGAAGYFSNFFGVSAPGAGAQGKTLDVGAFSRRKPALSGEVDVMKIRSQAEDAAKVAVQGSYTDRGHSRSNQSDVNAQWVNGRAATSRES